MLFSDFIKTLELYLLTYHKKGMQPLPESAEHPEI